MVPTIDFIDIGDVLDYEIIRRTIKSVDGATDTCVLAADDDYAKEAALIYYH